MFSSVYFSRHGNAMHCWEYDDDGNKVYKKDKAPFYFFMKTDGESEYKSIFGDNLKKVEFDTFSKFKETKEIYQSANRRLFESDLAVENRYIIDRWAGKEIKKPNLDVFYLDIEVHSEKGFPDPDTAQWPVTIITMWSTKQDRFYVLAEKEFDRNFKDKDGNQVLSDKDYVKICANEQELLKTFLGIIKKIHPDILSGWNSNTFDIPYLVNRCKAVLGENAAKSISPIGSINEREVTSRFGQKSKTYQIAGINLIDYLDLYKKYQPGQKSSFKLSYIAQLETGDTKLEFEGSLRELYHNNWQHYVEYNIQDVKLLLKIDAKKKFMDILINICYNCLVPLEQFHKTTKVLDGAFISRLCLEKIITPDSESMESEEEFDGAFVKDPDVGIHDWIVSFDATSLYPSIMMMHNISPETKVATVHPPTVNNIMQRMLGDYSGNDDPIAFSDEQARGFGLPNGKSSSVAEFLKSNNYSISTNGAIYRHDKKGIVSKFVKEWFELRQKQKKAQFECHKNGDHIGEANNKAAQGNYKILINSVYGYVGSKFSRFYDIDNALAVTSTGQQAITETMDFVDYYFREKWADSELGNKLKAKKIDKIVAYGDTDSCYLGVGKILKSYNYDDSNIQKTAEYIDKNICVLLNKIIGTATAKMSLRKMNCPENRITFKREMITRRTVFLAKKRYVAWVIVGEDGPVKPGSDHEIEVKGLEAVRSSTPEIVRENLIEFYKLVVQTVDQKKVDKFVKDVYTGLLKVEPEKIAKISSANGLEKWSDAMGESITGTPQHVKGALNYNKLIKRAKLENDNELIYEGDKVKFVYVKRCNKFPDFREDGISFKSDLPKDLGFDVDYDIMVQKVFVSPLEQFYECLHWQMPSMDTDNIEDLFS